MTNLFENNVNDFKEKIKFLHGPILILGGCSFLGANLFRLLTQYRNDVHTFVLNENSWRLEHSSKHNMELFQTLNDELLNKIITDIKPSSVFDCFNYEYLNPPQSIKSVYDLNFFASFKALSLLVNTKLSCYIHAGCIRKKNDQHISKAINQSPETNCFTNAKTAIGDIILNYGNAYRMPVINIQLPETYGPLQDISNPILEYFTQKIDNQNNLSEHLNCLFIDDAINLLFTAALKITDLKLGSSIDINSNSFEFQDWKPIISIEKGIKITEDWQRDYLVKNNHNNEGSALDKTYSVSAIIACYKDGQAIPIMYQRLKDVFCKLKIDYEIIFVNDCSPDDSENIICEISSKDSKVIGISHSRNFGSQSAFKSGMSISSMNSCVLLDGDLQDTPELIEKFVEKWREGFDVVYGRRVKREATWFMQIAYKAFYRVFDYLSYIPIPKDAGDFSLISKRVVKEMLKFPERDAFLRGIRAFVGFKQTGVDYIRPERMFGVTTNSFFKNIGWAKKGILSFSNKPLNILSFLGITLFPLSVFLGCMQVLSKLFFPELAPPGFTSTISIIIFFGAINLFAISVIGEYLAKIFEEVKQRPAFIQNKIIKNGSTKNL